MFGRRKPHALFHQTGGIADASDVVALSFNGKIVEIRAPKNDAGIGWRRKKAHMSEHPGVETHTFRKRLSCYGGLKHRPT
jgi:hypothetical protein